MYKTDPNDSNLLTRRELIAVNAMNGLIKAGYMNRDTEAITAKAVDLADALISRLNGEHLAQEN